MSLADYQSAVTDLVRDRDGVISDPQRDYAIQAAVLAYSIDSPRDVVVDITASGGQRIDLPAGFTQDSRVISVEYPIGDMPPSVVPLSEISIYASPTVRQIALPMWVDAGAQLRIGYTADHQLDDTDDSIPAKHAQAVACLAASYLCGQLASYNASESESTIGADTVNRETKSARWRKRQNDLAAEYKRIVGDAPSERRKAASTTVAVQRRNALGGRRLFHPTTHWPR